MVFVKAFLITFSSFLLMLHKFKTNYTQFQQGKSTVCDCLHYLCFTLLPTNVSSFLYFDNSEIRRLFTHSSLFNYYIQTRLLQIMFSTVYFIQKFLTVTTETQIVQLQAFKFNGFKFV